MIQLFGNDDSVTFDERGGSSIYFGKIYGQVIGMLTTNEWYEFYDTKYSNPVGVFFSDGLRLVENDGIYKISNDGGEFYREITDKMHNDKNRFIRKCKIVGGKLYAKSWSTLVELGEKRSGQSIVHNS